jgi:hypothetical protein
MKAIFKVKDKGQSPTAKNVKLEYQSGDFKAGSPDGIITIALPTNIDVNVGDIYTLEITKN